MALPFSEWSREAKDEFAQKRMEEMKLKNEALKQRHAEVEQDRIKAEAKHSAVTSLKISKKENIVCENDEFEDSPKVVKEREWDKGKIDQDAEDWSPPKFHGYRSRAPRRNFPDRRAPKKEENWRVRSANASKDRQSYSKFRSSGPNHKYQESSNYGSSGFRNENASFSRQRSRAHRTSSGTYRSFQNSRFDEPRKKSFSGGAGSASPSLSDSELEPVKHQAKPEVERIWQDGGIHEVQHKQSRVEKWVKAINTAGSWNEEYDNVKGGDYYTEKQAGTDAVKSYGYTNEEGNPKKASSSRDQSHIKNRERYDGLKYGQSSRGNLRARGNRTPTGERSIGGFENKNQKDFRKKNYSDKNRFRRESDLSDRTSSMKESDYHDFSKDKFNKTTSDSKSSDYSGKWEDEECEFKYVSEKRQFDKQSSEYIYGKPQNVQISRGQDGMKRDSFDDECGRNTLPKFQNSYVRDKSKIKNLRNTDHGGFDDPHFDNRSGSKRIDYSFSRVKANKFRTESKFVGYSGKLENEGSADTRVSRKYKVSKPSPKRTLSNPVKSVDTSSSASKTMEFNSPDEDVWGGYEDSGVAWNLDANNDTQADHKRNPWEEEADGNVTQAEHKRNLWEEEACRNNDTQAECKRNLWEEEADGNNDAQTEHKNNLWEEEPDVNDTHAEHKNDLWEEEADGNKVFEPLDYNTHPTTDFNTSSKKLFYQNSELKIDEVSGYAGREELFGRNNVEQDIEVYDKVALISSESSVERHDTDKNFASMTEDQNFESNDLVGNKDGEYFESATGLDETSEIQMHGAKKDCIVLTEGKQESINDNLAYSRDQNKDEIHEQQPSSDVVNVAIDSCETKIRTAILSNDSVSPPEIQNSQGVTVQSTIIEQTSVKTPNIVNPGQSNFEVTQEKNNVKDASPNKFDCETSSEPIVENDNAKTVQHEVKAVSSQSINAACTKDDSESPLKSSDIVTPEPLSPKQEGNIENISGALNLSDDGGWSTISEDENNDTSDDDKSKKESNSANKSEIQT